MQSDKERNILNKKIKLTLEEYIIINSLLEENKIEVNKQLEKVLNDEKQDKKDYTATKRILTRQLKDIQNIKNKIKELL